jgi:hypothetical protein
MLAVNIIKTIVTASTDGLAMWPLASPCLCLDLGWVSKLLPVSTLFQPYEGPVGSLFSWRLQPSLDLLGQPEWD